MGHPEPLFSVIIPAFDNPDGLRACLEALTRQSLAAGQFEVIVVDDGSPRPLHSIAEEFTGQLQVTCLRVPNAGPAAARNHGARAAKGRYLAFTDHDCRPSEVWLIEFLDGFSAHPESLLGGPKHNGLPRNPYSSAHQIASNFAEQWFRTATGIPGYFTTNNIAVPRELFLKIGGFDESFSFAHEDREFGARWADRALPSAWIPGAVVVHRHELTFRAFLRQHFRYGAAAIDFRAARSRVPAGPSVRFEGLRFHLGLLAAPFRQPAERRLALAALLLSAQAVYVAGYLTAGPGRRQRPR